MKTNLTKFQIGKNGITPGVIESLALALANHRQIRISVLPSSGRNRENIEKMALEIQEKLKLKTNFRIIGFTIILIKSQSSN